MIFVLMLGIIIGSILSWVLDLFLGIEKCKHKYKLVKDGDITNLDRRGNVITVGFLKLYECEHCKKLKTQKAYVN